MVSGPTQKTSEAVTKPSMKRSRAAASEGAVSVETVPGTWRPRSRSASALTATDRRQAATGNSVRTTVDGHASSSRWPGGWPSERLNLKSSSRSTQQEGSNNYEEGRGLHVDVGGRGQRGG